ncbi:MAG TPA: hypothetical protein VFQ95_07340 [Rhodanobacteraceae bacterium]|nr:hypothetical protein [Rhodanobacteraceae bacterium]
MTRSATMTVDVDVGHGGAPEGAHHDAPSTGADARAPGAQRGDGIERDDRAQAMQDRADAALEELDQRKAGARRTAWIIAAIAAAFFIASLFQGHFAHIPH